MNTPARQSTGQSLGYWIGDEEVNGDDHYGDYEQA